MKSRKLKDKGDKSAAPKIYHLKIALNGSEPPIWRLVAVKGNVSLDKLHRIIQCAMGWENYHLHEFIIKGERIGTVDLDFDSDPDVVDEKQVLLQDVVKQARSKFSYVYDFGDDWEHEIVVKKITPPEENRHYPCCLAGERACPPEDSGGIWGYEELLDITSNPDHPDYEEMREWLGEGFDPGAFDLAAVNLALQRFK
ncbi:MAG: plasmid pRiA4b ORF-3 family protein [Deltaproteobacteria bacterium]|nr:plasmid pRiA4b ORF-3 family protein [Deltaproteobacteria bacterium]